MMTVKHSSNRLGFILLSGLFPGGKFDHFYLGNEFHSFEEYPKAVAVSALQPRILANLLLTTIL